MNNEILEKLENKLLPCPCCGGKAKIKISDTLDNHFVMLDINIAVIYIQCSTCKLESTAVFKVLKNKLEIGQYIGKSKYDMIFKVTKKWNKRTSKRQLKTFVNGLRPCPFCGGNVDLELSYTNRNHKRMLITNKYNGKYEINDDCIIPPNDCYTIICNNCCAKRMTSFINIPSNDVLDSIKYRWNFSK